MLTDTIGDLIKCRFGRRNLAQGVECDKVMDRAVILRDCHRNAGIGELASIGFAFVTQWIVFRRDY